ncbi:thiamine phosphate synthase [Pandoraea nosoerga]|nr:MULTISPECIES: thiamine phosphate synthase [Pandoraea]MBN4667159.1 thiamine phosphate synthase [Pandoraea nosoerga]MBN4677147.1 thiamine phosphate synthase [Pandoraea nosoerga]MBN4682033.1 thiamine phosphate synthase [Pandoraea nosoerga]MBN4746350.1 thiamine phosphate synthase [Pandoraea nosoerga]
MSGPPCGASRVTDVTSGAPAAALPRQLLVTPDVTSRAQIAAFASQLAQALARGIRLVQLRNRSLDADGYRALAESALALTHAAGAQLLLNPPHEVADLWLDALGAPGGAHAGTVPQADGWHLTSARLMASRERPAGWKRVSAACHDAAQLAQAAHLGLDFVTLSPVLATATHPDAAPLGWAAFSALAARTPLPVFALGGMRADMLASARNAGAHGIAAIRAFWPAA